MSDGPLLNDVTRAFAEAHRNEDVRDLALKTKRTADLDLPAALDQIAGWQIARNKLPQWAACADIVYPAHISMEQCSSQFTAQYKAEIARRLLRSLPQSAGQTANDVTMTDLTGGFGVDFSYLARGFGHATYVERQSHLCELAAHNMAALGLTQAQVVCGDGVEYLRAMEPAQLIYIDPARRDEHGARTYAIEDCTPDALALRDLLLADTADELEVMEEDDDPYVARVVELREQAKVDRTGAFEGFSRLVEELEAKCAVAELLATGPVQTQFCDNQLVRMVLPVLEEDRSVRILRAPDALYFAQHEICSFYVEQEDFERALPEVRHLYDLARSSMQSHFALINVLARLERFDEIIEVARHGLRIASDRSAIGYLFYRLAFAYWNCDQLDLALACYRLGPRGEESGSSALEEMQGLMNEMGVSEPPTFEEAVETIRKAGLELPPVSAVTNQLADAAVQLVDNGFFFLARGCIFQMWRTMGNDELGSLNRSLG